MKFTFGIITDGSDRARLETVIRSIQAQNIAHSEIIIVGGAPLESVDGKHIRHIPFDETQRHAWITRKKNLITENAKNDYIVFMHDYVVLEPGWYLGFLNYGFTESYGRKRNIIINPIINADGTRYRDLTLFPAFHTMWHHVGAFRRGILEIHQELTGTGEHECLIPYDLYYPHSPLRNWMYISGAYWVASKKLMQEIPLNEALSWGQGEDVIWSEKTRNHGEDIYFNRNSTVRLLKSKDVVFKPLTEETIKRMQERGWLLK